VLIGANMPSILAEISFVSNPVDERRLATAEYRERIAESIDHFRLFLFHAPLGPEKSVGRRRALFQGH